MLSRLGVVIDTIMAYVHNLAAVKTKYGPVDQTSVGEHQQRQPQQLGRHLHTYGKFGESTNIRLVSGRRQ